MTTPTSTQQQLAAQRARLSEQLTAALTALFASLGSWRDADADRFARQAVPLVQGAQQALAGLVSAYLAQRLSEQTGQSVLAPAIPTSTVTGLRGADAAEVYRRPFRELWAALANGKSLPQAIEQGRARLVELADGDLQTTYAHANQAGMERFPEPVRPAGWRRVLQGESSCALCVLASTHRYTIADLNPIHPHCDCTVEPIYGRDEVRAADDAMLERVHQAAAELTGQTDRSGRKTDYRQIQITHEHGELGPMLARPGDHFTGPSEIPST